MREKDQTELALEYIARALAELPGQDRTACEGWCDWAMYAAAGEW